MAFDSAIIDQIRNTASIEEVIGEKIPLIPKGREFLALCPFHNDTKPSMHVSPQKQLFKCFACDMGGDVFKFLMEYEHLSFPEAVKNMAQKYGIALNEQDSRHFQRHERYLYIKHINSFASKIFYAYLMRHKGGKAGRDYLHQRGIGKKVCQTFQLGFAPKAYRFLWNFIQKHYPEQEWSNCGLFFQKPGKTPIDFFRNRIMFPIFNERNEVIAFGGRLIEEGEPKYINTSDTPVFKKFQQLYGLNWCYHQMGRQKTAYIVEGYLDVMACQQQHIPAVAPLGTALTEEQIRKLKRYAQTFILIFDGDVAGRRAALKASRLLLENNVGGKVVLLPDGQDPFDFLKSNHKKAFLELCESHGQAIEDFYIYADLPPGELDSPGKSQVAKAWLPLIQAVKDPLVKENLKKKMAGALTIDPNLLEKLWEENKRPVRLVAPSQAKKMDLLEEAFTLFLCRYPSFIRNAATIIGPEDLRDKRFIFLYKKLQFIRDKENIKLAQILDLFPDEKIKDYLTTAVMKQRDDDSTQEKQFREYNDYICKLRKRILETKIHRTRTTMREAELTGKPIEKMLEDLQLYSLERDRLNEQLRD